MSVERQIGNCQACAVDFKLRDGRMVHHGYERPGIGYDIGDCLGVGHVPYEVSCELVRQRKLGIEMHRARQVERLGEIERREIDEYTHKEYRPGKMAEDRVKKGQIKCVPARDFANPGHFERYYFSVTYTKHLTPSYDWNEFMQSLAREAKLNIRSADGEIAFLSQRIADWRPRPIRTVEEEEHKESAAKAERAAAKAATKAEKEAKSAEKEAEKERKAIEKMRKFSPEIAALKDHLRELAERHARASSNEEKVKIQVNAHDSVSRLVGYDTPLGAAIEARFLRNLDMDTELVRLTILSGRRLRSGQIDYEESGNRWGATGE